ncbi:unnamed protein product [Rangifer tarandus platyrhynchus]|uniref:Uncharacterized protein n=1 Tax=Rangifer tarandus platyrhynchus TaxID=3082113 RepID=A0ABN8ZR68_RANTA|nr:unnamed protein product [Rangifer tarandus platyrhynchus]
MRQESDPGEAEGGGGERAWLGSLRAVKRRPAIVRRRPGCATGFAAGLAPGAEVGRGQRRGLGWGWGQVPAFPARTEPRDAGPQGPRRRGGVSGFGLSEEHHRRSTGASAFDPHERTLALKTRNP